ncbi:CPBP family intramembrane glutamic endopeptidase [Jeotgalibacillus proteolyticus]|uniref:CPBP family intramembrane metalloprotease n=1 Tax=Jeotgalibacillus proteolyticus TaxID=2082395 RepID=A0A2S5GGY4_9BACL|nr:CPBP family intramembrane glutamic endopeptidase [Jeotgalibacillus proteolyticus]PPA72236.1 CPBP family intramembrane metalloprotease [Jeotgalibacillus proteolyticus]
MNKQLWWLITSMLIIQLLMFITFFDKNIFWYLYSGTALVMIALSITKSGLDEPLPQRRYFLAGIVSGIVLYGLFFLGYQLLSILPGNLDRSADSLFNQLHPDNTWKWLLLILIIIPAEEIFWRGFVQRILHKHFSQAVTILITALLAGSVFYYSGEWIWVAAAFFGSVFWGILYAWKRSVPMVILSHLTFDFLFFSFAFL